MLHRDDIPFEDIENIEAMIQEANPDIEFRLLFPGDMPANQIPKEMREAIKAMESLHEQSVRDGTCLICGDAIEDYDPHNHNWVIPEYWHCVVDSTGRPCGWRCDECALGPDGMLTVFGETEEVVDENERWTITDKEPEDDGLTGRDALEGDFE